MSKSLSDLISVYKAHGRLEGEMVKAFLEANGVRSIISQEAAGSIYGLTLGDLGIVNLLVYPENFENASLLIKQMDEGEFIETEFQQDSFDDEVNLEY